MQWRPRRASARSLAASPAGRSLQRDGVAALTEEVFVKSKPWPFNVGRFAVNLAGWGTVGELLTITLRYVSSPGLLHGGYEGEVGPDLGTEKLLSCIPAVQNNAPRVLSCGVFWLCHMSASRSSLEASPLTLGEGSTTVRPWLRRLSTLCLLGCEVYFRHI